MTSLTGAPLAKIVAVTSENQELKSKLTESRTQCENLEQELRFQTAKALEFQEMLALKSDGDVDALLAKFMEHSLTLAEQTLEIDQLKLKLRESEKEKIARDQEREAHIEMMASLNRYIRQQGIALQRLENPSSLTPKDYEYDEIDSEFDQLCNIHDHLKDVKLVIERKEAPVVIEDSQKVKKLNKDLKQVLAERAHLKRKVEAQNAAISILQERSKTRETSNLALVKDLKEKYESEKRGLQDTLRSLEAQIQTLRQNEEQSESEPSCLHGELIEIESQKYEENYEIYEPLLFLTDTKADCDVFEDDASEITASTFLNSESEQSTPASMSSLHQRKHVSLDDYMDFGTKFEAIADFSMQRFEI
ncbi:unnamed protein product [Cylindrotheca closterium]|uniref:Uncharacterized protein n=1 Tax=Cylindrotheca closterium TaxID=2856 RepID=A0AAD2PVY7_9STRA|nr:unnamed protein product [Cylindrotheca closterium]